MMANRYIKILFIAVLLVLVFFILNIFSDIVAYILMAWVVSMLGSPIVDFLLYKLHFDKLKIGRSLAAIITLILFLGIIIGISFIFIPVILEQAANLARVDMNAVIAALQEPINELMFRLQKIGLVESSANTDQQIREQLSKLFQPSKISYFFSSFISIASSISIAVFSVMFIAFFFLQEQGLFIQFLQNFVPSRFEEKVRKTVDEVSNLLTRYFGGVLLQIAIISTYLLILLSIVGVKNALLIAVFAALINVIPYLGPLIGGTFGIMLTITSSLELDFYTEMMPLLIKVLLCFMSMQMIDNPILQPFIFSNRVRAHPLEIFIIIMIGAKLGGIVGMVLAIPAYTVIRVIARTFLSEFEIIQKIAIGLKQPLPEKSKIPEQPQESEKPPFTEV